MTARDGGRFRGGVSARANHEAWWPLMTGRGEELLYHLVGADQQPSRYGETERLGRLEVDQQSEPCRLLRARREWPRGCYAADSCDEIAASHLAPRG